MTMNKSEKYRRASLAQLTPEQLATARRNYQYCARRFPEEQGKIAAMIEDRGLGDHREVLEHYARNKSPISEYELGLIGLYGDTSYQGAHGKGRQYYAPSTNSPSLVSGPASEVSLVGGAGQVGGRAPTGIESLYRPEVSPEGGA